MEQMIADSPFHSFVTQDIANTLRLAGEEFVAAERDNNVSERLGRKYHNALSAYRNALYECPWAPGNMIIDPSAHDGMMREKMSAELTRVQNEILRILDQFGGVLSLAHGDEA
jgi:hypothetical protein